MFATKMCQEYSGVSDVVVFGTRWLKEKKQENRCALLQAAIEDRMSRSDGEPGLRLQVFFARPDLAYVGERSSPHLGGVFKIPESKTPPSRAYTKLLEAMILRGWSFRKNETVLDLGASPGGWTWVAAQDGAQVIAVDRAELSLGLMKNPRVKFVKADVFRFRPKKTVDWVICDVIAEPEKSLELLIHVLKEIKPDRVIWTLKFRGGIQFSVINLADKLLSDFRYWIRALSSNKNEVTVMVDRRES
ncbi:MAG: hypothetical protein K2X47_04400 [Bdellovibrionales bacterium]|nr:hypothetical protein [Bdellovibrionales bacterium]